MKKYILIDTYPGSPEIGHVISPMLEGYYCWNHHWFDPKDFPKSWEEVVGPGFEITSFTNPSNNLAYTINPTAKEYYVNVGTNRSIDFCLRFYKIKSVKRLSDGETFKIGDNTTLGTISQIQWDCEKGLWLDFKTDKGCYHGGYGDYEKITKKRCSFITSDGVQMYLGDTYYTLGTPDYYWSVQGFKVDLISEELSPVGSIQFSTLELAEEYIKNNRPRRTYTEGEVVRALEHWGMCKVELRFVNLFLDN